MPLRHTAATETAPGGHAIAAPRLDFPIAIPGLPKSAKPPSLRAEYYASSALTSRLLEIAGA